MQRAVIKEVLRAGFNPWPKDTLLIPYASPDRGVGPGEERVAKILGGKIMGSGHPFDITVGSEKWEVKEIDPTGRLRAGAEGRQAAEKVKDSLTSVADVIAIALPSIEKSDALPQDVIDLLIGFVGEDIPMIKRGEISKSRVEKLISAVEIIARSITINDAQKQIDLHTDTGVIEKDDVDVVTFVRIGKMLGLSRAEMNVSRADLLASLFDHVAFKNPGAYFKKNWTNGIKPSACFPPVNGVVLVKHDGFRIIDAAEIDSSFELHSITKGDVKLKVVV